MKTNLKDILNGLYHTNNSLRQEHSGLYYASIGEHYKYVWIRDVYYQVAPLLKNNPTGYIQTYRSLLDYYKGLNFKYDNKVDHLIKKPFPLNNVRFIHPRFYDDLTEITGDWGNMQLDSFGYFFLGIAEGIKNGLNILRDETDFEIINKLIKILYKINFWTIEDNGIWEENTEIHASSIGAILGGLKALEEVDFFIPNKMFIEGNKKLNEILPRESVTKIVDLSLLTLIYPFNVVDADKKHAILENIHTSLERKNGIIRYKGDKYYNVSGAIGNEAEWPFGFAYISLIYAETDPIKSSFYLDKIVALIDEKFYIPELFFANTKFPNDNNPLGWTIGILIMCIEKHLSNLTKHNF